MQVKLNDKFKKASIFLNEILSQIEDLNVKKQICENDKLKPIKNSIFEDFIGKYVIIRTYTAGVHFGILKECEGKILKLKNSRRIFRWSGAFTLSEIANNGLGENSKVAEELNEIVLTEAIEIIPCSEKSKKCFINFPVFVPKGK